MAAPATSAVSLNTLDLPLATKSVTAMSESHGVNSADGELYGQKDDTDTVTIAEAEHTCTLPYYVDWSSLRQDFENTDPLQSRDQQSPEQGNNDAVSVDNFDEEVSGTSEDHYHCDHPGCGLKFSTMSLLSHHAVRHQREHKSHKCEQCHMSFRYPKDLRRHQKTHVGIKSEACEFDGCTKFFTRRDNLQRHMKGSHRAEAVNDPSEAVVGPQANSTSLVKFCQDSVGPNYTFWPTMQSRMHEDHLKRPCSPLQTRDTIWKGERGFHDVGEPCLVDSKHGIVFPSEIEEAEEYLSEVHSDDHVVEPTYESDSDSDSDSDSGISSRFARLNCEDQEEEPEMTQKRLERRLRKRVDISVFKRPHSQSEDGDTAATDTDNADERSGDASIRRLRRRVLDPVGGPFDWESETSSSSEDFTHDERGRFPDTLEYLASQGLETPIQGHRDATYQQIDTMGQLDPCQSSHAPPSHVDASLVDYDALQAPDLRNQGTVIPCPLKQQSGCSGKDANMATLERKLRSKCHGIYYHNQCKRLLSAFPLPPSDDAELLRKSHAENERLWSSHIKECQGKFCVLAECAPDPLGDLRHERNGRCKKTRGEVKQAEFNYLCHTLGVSQQNIEIGVKHDHEGQRKTPRTTRASLPNVKTEQDALVMERDGISPEDDKTRLTRDVEKLKGSIQILEKDREEHLSIMRHLVHDMLQNHVELTDIVRERLDRHAPSVLPKHSWEPLQNKPTTYHVHTHPGTPGSSSATPTVVKRDRDGNPNIRWTRSPPSALAQDLPRSGRNSLLSPAKRQRTILAAQDDALLPKVLDSQSDTSRYTPMSLANPFLHFDQPAYKQVTLGHNHGQGLSDNQHTSGLLPKKPEVSFAWTEDTTTSIMSEESERVRQRPAPEFVRPVGITPPQQQLSIGYMSEDPPCQSSDDVLDLFADVATRPGGDAILGIGPKLEWQGSTEHFTGFVDDSFDSSFRDDWPSFENSFPPEQ